MPSTTKRPVITVAFHVPIDDLTDRQVSDLNAAIELLRSVFDDTAAPAETPVKKLWILPRKAAAKDSTKQTTLFPSDDT